MSAFLKAFDLGLYRLEQFLLCLSCGIMVLLLSLDVTQRIFSAPMPLVGDFTLSIIVYGLLVAGSITSFKNRLKGILWGTAIFVLGFFGINGFLYLLPLGIPGAQKFALGCMVWASFMGAAIATHQKGHIGLAALFSKVDKSVQPWFTMISNLLASGFVAFLAVLAILQFRYEWADWVSTPGAGEFEAYPIPLWTVTLALPVAFCFIALHFLIHALDFSDIKKNLKKVA